MQRLIAIFALSLATVLIGCAPYNHSHGVQTLPSVPPVGTIVPYWGNVNDIPEGWRICDGGVISDTRSPLNGQRVPELRDNRFLMGINGSTIADLVAQRGGRNDIPDDGAHAHSATATRNITHLPWAAGQQFQREGGNTHAHSHPVDVSQAGSHSHGAENRPSYQAVFYIVRIF